MTGPLIAFAVLALALVLAMSAFRTVRVSRWEQTALYRNGGFDRMLEPGRHVLFHPGARIHLTPVSMGPTYLGTGPVEVVTADGLPIRLAATVIYRIVDPELSLQHPPHEAVRLAAAQALLDLASKNRLDALLARAEPFDDALLASTGGRAGPAEIERLALSGVVLPPELRRSVTEVERARLDGLAALERSRGEHAALRSLANAARLLKDNPELMNLRLLQAVGVAGKGATIMVGEGALKPVYGPGKT